MFSFNKKEPIFLLVGDIIFFIVSLWVMLWVRYQSLPTTALFYDHIRPFSILFIVWLLVFLIAGLYEKHTTLLQGRLPQIILKAQLVNSALAVLFFYFIPYFGITPKINLFIYLVISFFLILFWRMRGSLSLGAVGKEKALLVGSGEEMRELRLEVNANARYNLIFVETIDLDSFTGDLQKEIISKAQFFGIQVVVIDMRNPKVKQFLPGLYDLIFSNIRFIAMHKIYEDTFVRIPLSLVQYTWFLENISIAPKLTYDLLKRAMDILLSIPLLLIPALSLPFVALAQRWEGPGQIFIRQERIGKNNRSIFIYKYRTMLFDDEGEGKNLSNRVTKVGSFLRKSRLDEFPQLWNVLRGDISLIGPRPELPKYVSLYEKQIPYYNIRHLIKPGLSGWAQLYHEAPPKFEAQYDATKMKLSYDLYYIKNRSFFLDIKIALRTIKTLLSRSGI